MSRRPRNSNRKRRRSADDDGSGSLSPAASRHDVHAAPELADDETTAAATATMDAAEVRAKRTKERHTAATHRLYVGGLGDDGDANSEVIKRLRGYVNVDRVEVIRDSEGLSRGFAYVTVSASTAEVERMTKTLNGTLWHGRRLRIAPAKADYMAKLKTEWAEIEAADAVAKKKERIANGETDSESSDLPLRARAMRFKKHSDVDAWAESNATRRGWKRSKGGRPVPIMQLPVRSSRHTFVHDPVALKNKITVHDPRYDDVSDDDGDWAHGDGGLPSRRGGAAADRAWPTGDRQDRGRSPRVVGFTSELWGGDGEGDNGNGSVSSGSVGSESLSGGGGRGVLAMDATGPRMPTKATLTSEFASGGLFDGGDSGSSSSSSDGGLPRAGKRAFAADAFGGGGGDGDDDDPDSGDMVSFGVRKEFEGEAGEKLFRLQQRYRGDERFKLTKDFADDDDDDDDDGGESSDSSDGVGGFGGGDGDGAVMLGKAEKAVAASVLNSLFPPTVDNIGPVDREPEGGALDAYVHPERRGEGGGVKSGPTTLPGWQPVARYDPTAPEAAALEIRDHEDSEDGSDGGKDGDGVNASDDDSDGDGAKATNTRGRGVVIDTSVHFPTRGVREALFGFSGVRERAGEGEGSFTFSVGSPAGAGPGDDASSGRKLVPLAPGGALFPVDNATAAKVEDGGDTEGGSKGARVKSVRGLGVGGRLATLLDRRKMGLFAPSIEAAAADSSLGDSFWRGEGVSEEQVRHEWEAGKEERRRLAYSINSRRKDAKRRASRRDGLRRR